MDENKLGTEFNSNDLVLVYDDQSHRSEDICGDSAATKATADDLVSFATMVNDFVHAASQLRPGQIGNVRRHHSLRLVPLSAWLARFRDARHTAYNTPVLLIFVFFLFVAPDKKLFASFQTFESILAEIRQCVNIHAVVRHDSEYPETAALCSTALVPSVHEKNPSVYTASFRRLTEYATKTVWFPSRYQFNVFVPSEARQGKEYAKEALREHILNAYLDVTRYRGLLSFEAAALSSIIVEGLANPGDSAWGHFVIGSERLYDPRLFLYIWHFVTGDTKPNTEKRKYKD